MLAGAAVATDPVAVAVAVAVGGLLGALAVVRSERITLLALTVVFTANVAVPIFQMLPDVTYYVAVTGVSVLVTVVALARTAGRRRAGSLGARGVLLFAGFAAASLVLSPDSSVGGSVAQLALMACTVVLGARTSLEERNLFWRVLVAAAAAEAVLAVLEVTVGVGPVWVGAAQAETGVTRALMSDVLPGLPRAQGTLGHGIPLAALLLIAISAVTAGIVEGRLLRIACVALLVAGVIASGTRSALLLLPLVLVLPIPFRSTANRVLALLALLVPTVGYLIYTGPRYLLGALGLTDIQSTGSYTHRAGAWEAVQRLAANSDALQVLFGHGYASIPRLFRHGLLQADGLRSVDNQIVETFAQLGVVGALLLTVVLARAVVQARGAVRAGLLIVAGQFLVFCVLDRPSIYMLLFTFVGFSSAAASSRLAADACCIICSASGCPTRICCASSSADSNCKVSMLNTGSAGLTTGRDLS